jgi:hypothetical protein
MRSPRRANRRQRSVVVGCEDSYEIAAHAPHSCRADDVLPLLFELDVDLFDARK